MATDLSKGYDFSWDCPHLPGAQELWQESDFLYYYDAAAEVGGSYRLGQHPNLKTGQASVHAVALRGMTYATPRKAGEALVAGHPLTAEDRWATGHRAGGHIVEALGDGKMQYVWDEQDCAGELEWYESYFEPRDWSKTGHSKEFMATINSDGHLEAFGRVRGYVRIGPDTYTIDALSYRDRSWGFRDSSSVLMHRYRQFTGTVGPELSFTSFFLDHRDFGPSSAGFVVRNGVDTDVEMLRCRVTFDYDNLTPLAATGVLTLEDGEMLEVNATALHGRGSFFSDTLCEVRYGASTGFCFLHAANNPTRGTYAPTADDVTFLCLEDGLTPTTPYDG